MEIATLDQKPHLRSATLQLIEQAFNYQAPNSFAVDFAPLWDEKQLCHNYLIISPEDQVIAHLGVRIRFLGGKNKAIPIAMLGGIAVAAPYQGQGFFRTLMDKVLATYQNQVAFFILWSDRPTLYQKFNFFLAGGQLVVHPPGRFDIPSSYRHCKFHLLSADQQQMIKHLYQSMAANYLTLQRTEDDWQLIAKITSIDWYLKEDSQGDILAYFCCNKGQDLANVIHECGHAPNYHMDLWQDLAHTPCWIPESAKIHFPRAGNSQMTYLAHFRCGNFSLFQQLLADATNDILRIHSSGNHLITVYYQEKYFQITFAKFFTWIFGPWPPPAFAQLVPSLYIWGTDSI